MHCDLSRQPSLETEKLKYLHLRICGLPFGLKGVSKNEGTCSFGDNLGCMRVTMSMVLKRFSGIEQDGLKRVGSRDEEKYGWVDKTGGEDHKMSDSD